MKTYQTPIDPREERINSITHMLGVLFGLAAIPILIYNALNKGSSWVVAGTVIYGISFLMVFTFSTLFHRQQQGKMRELFKKLDHISIYYLIAGTYTPFILVFVNNSFGLTLLAVLWGLAALGTLFKVYFTGRFEILSVLIYVAMGWMLLVGGNRFFAEMPYSIATLIVCGGCLYSIGVIFYIWKLHTYHHAIWHLFVLIAAICHFTAVSLAV